MYTVYGMQVKYKNLLAIFYIIPPMVYMKLDFMKIIYLVIGILGVILAFKVFNSGTSAVDQNEVLSHIKDGALIVDVRSVEEYASGHYENSKNIPIDQVQSRLNEFGPKDGKIVIYCQSGRRATEAKRILNANGFKNVLNAGGIRDMPIVKQ